MKKKATINDLRKAVRQTRNNPLNDLEYVQGLYPDAPERVEYNKQQQERQHQSVVKKMERMLRGGK